MAAAYCSPAQLESGPPMTGQLSRRRAVSLRTLRWLDERAKAVRGRKKIEAATIIPEPPDIDVIPAVPMRGTIVKEVSRRRVTDDRKRSAGARQRRQQAQEKPHDPVVICGTPIEMTLIDG